VSSDALSQLIAADKLTNTGSRGNGLRPNVHQSHGSLRSLQQRLQVVRSRLGPFIRASYAAHPLTQTDALSHEIQIDDLGAGTPAGQGIHRTGAIYGLQAPTAFPARPPGEWNTYLIETAGPKIKVTLNGVLVNDYTSTRQQNGFLALQVHSFPSKIQFRNLQVK
jgi:hypothetical protein